MRAVRSLLALKGRDNNTTVTIVIAVIIITDHVITDPNKK
jgi:hypothetical protein